VVAGLALSTPACSQTPRTAAAPAPLSNTFESPDAIAAAILDGLANRDHERLAALALSEAEFRDHVWPALPASTPARHVPVDYAWAQLRQRSEQSLRSVVARHSGKRLRLVRVQFTGATTNYGTFDVLRKSEVIIADENGRESSLRLFGSAMVQEDRYKLFSYAID
jgi:hypothetical protein